MKPKELEDVELFHGGTVLSLFRPEPWGMLPACPLALGSGKVSRNLQGSLLGATADGHGSGGCCPLGHEASFQMAERGRQTRKEVERKGAGDLPASLGEAEFTPPTLELWWRACFRPRVWWGVWQLALPGDEK